jgi:hypothetical protein
MRPISEAQILELRVDELGRAWLEVPRVDVKGDRQWWIFDSAGRWIARATTPPYDQMMLEVGSNHVLLRRLDADDVQTVVGCAVNPRA